MLDAEVNKSHDIASRASAPTPPPEDNMNFTEPDKSTTQFFDERGKMLAANKVGVNNSGKDDDKGMVTLAPMSQLQASSTIVNLLLATGPFA